VVIQTLHPEHYALQSVKAHDLTTFYEREVKLRAELGYPPFRRLCIISVRGPSEGGARRLVSDCSRALGDISGLTVYPAAPFGDAGARSRRWQLLIKGPSELPRLIAPALSPFLERRRRGGGMLEIEMDPA
jgi:primosomal protein N' (replication factor Y)